jgi:hypothetical protein
MTCEKCGCCEVHVYKPGTPDELAWSMCLWCADGVPCPNAKKKKHQAAAQKAAAAVEPPHHDHGVMHFAGPSKVSRAYRTPQAERARSIPTTVNGDEMPKNNIEELRNDLFETSYRYRFIGRTQKPASTKFCASLNHWSSLRSNNPALSKKFTVVRLKNLRCSRSRDRAHDHEERRSKSNGALRMRRS